MLGILSGLPAQTSNRQYRAGDEGLFFTPTAYTTPQGRLAVSLYDLVYYQISYNPTGSTHLSISAMNPLLIDNVDNPVLFGIKQNFLKTGYLQSAAWATGSTLAKGCMFGCAASLGNRDISLHGNLVWWTDLETIDPDNVITAGIKVRIEPELELYGEMISTKLELEDWNQSLVTACLRFKFKRACLDAGVISVLDSGKPEAYVPGLKLVFIF